jgi:hypothetical protein
VHAPVRRVPPVKVATALGFEVPLRNTEELDVDVNVDVNVDVVVLTSSKNRNISHC